MKTVTPKQLTSAYKELFPTGIRPEDDEDMHRIFGNWLALYNTNPEAAISVSNWGGKVTKALFKALDVKMPKTKAAMMKILQQQTDTEAVIQLKDYMDRKVQMVIYLSELALAGKGSVVVAPAENPDWRMGCFSSIESARGFCKNNGFLYEDITEGNLAYVKNRMNPQPAVEDVVMLSVWLKVKVNPGANVQEFIENMDYSFVSNSVGVVVLDTEIVDTDIKSEHYPAPSIGG